MSGVLVTRPAEQAGFAQNRLVAAGFTVFLAPLLEIVPLPWQAPDIVPQAVLLTSANAIPALAVSSLLRSVPVYAVGAATAEQVRQAGFIHVVSADGDVRALEALVLEKCSHGLGALLYLAGETVAGQLAARLGAAGFWVETHVVYRASAVAGFGEDVRQALAAQAIQHVLLYSPRSAAVFSRLVDAPLLRAQLTLVCLSPAIASAAGSGWKAVTISAAPNEESLLEALVKPANMV